MCVGCIRGYGVGGVCVGCNSGWGGRCVCRLYQGMGWEVCV